MQITCPECERSFETQAEAAEVACPRCGKKFTPQAVSTAAESCARFFEQMGE